MARSVSASWLSGPGADSNTALTKGTGNTGTNAVIRAISRVPSASVCNAGSSFIRLTSEIGDPKLTAA